MKECVGDDIWQWRVLMVTALAHLRDNVAAAAKWRRYGMQPAKVAIRCVFSCRRLDVLAQYLCNAAV